MNNLYTEHPTEEALERFVLKRSPEEESEVLETHILACEQCVDRLETLELEISTLKETLAASEADRIKKELAPTRSSWRNWFTVPTLSWAGAAVAALAIGLAVIPSSMPRSYNLSAYRNHVVTVLPEGKPVDLHLDATDIQQGPVEAEVVTSIGSQVWTGKTSVKKQDAEVKLPKIEQSGTYFLRLYSAQANNNRDLLREYRFDVK